MIKLHLSTDYYEAYGADAVAVHEVTGRPISITETRIGQRYVVRFSRESYGIYYRMLVKAGYRVSIEEMA